MKKNILYCLFLSIACLSFIGADWITLSSVEFEKVFHAQENIFKKSNSYSMNIKHTSFEGHESVVHYEQVTGFIHRDGSNYHSLILGQRTVQNEKIKLVIDSAEKSILITTPDKSFDPITEDALKKSMEGCNIIKTRALSKDANAYRLEYKKGNALEATEYFTAEGGRITKMVMYYSELTYDPGFREKLEKYKPRVEIEFGDFKTGVRFNFKNEFDETHYIVFDGKKYSGAGDYKNYHVFDTRPPVK
jgi:cobalamin biosynthesis Mg chelatase CobN